MESKFYFPFCFLHTSLRVDFEKSYREVLIRIKIIFKSTHYQLSKLLKISSN